MKCGKIIYILVVDVIYSFNKLSVETKGDYTNSKSAGLTGVQEQPPRGRLEF